MLITEKPTCKPKVYKLSHSYYFCTLNNTGCSKKTIIIIMDVIKDIVSL